MDRFARARVATVACVLFFHIERPETDKRDFTTLLECFLDALEKDLDRVHRILAAHAGFFRNFCGDHRFRHRPTLLSIGQAQLLAIHRAGTIELNVLFHANP